ncbi:hypothetical protein EVAR_53973_1 [Eumeta japonica]|uniref:Uncharacterized protein n=1 Tax=Eumeta variegata TaxID=151549 RepID=A0A4C1Y2E3_EUMVA|nr:hypothetical protein EVAR_53973_1 [Eumeta japonica]
MAVSHACLTHSVYRSTTRRVGHTSLQPPPSRQSELSSFALSNAVRTPTTEPSLCCRFVCPGRVQVRTAPVRTLNVTALWSEDVTSDHHSSALSSRAELHAVTSTVLARDGPLYTSNGDIPSLSTCNPPRRGSRRVLFRVVALTAPPHAPCVDVAPRMILFVPSFEQTHFTRSRYGPIGLSHSK